MAQVVIYSTRFCPFCVRARMLLDNKGVAYEDIDVAADRQRRLEMMAKSGRHTVPQIWIGEQHIGGCDELQALERAGELDALLGLESA